MNRCGGVLLHISSLPGKYGIGTFGKEARFFVDFLSDCGFGAWQVLPLTPCDSFNSPYSGKSAFAGNMFFIDPQILFEKNLLTEDEVKLCEHENIHTVKYDFLKSTREDVFRRAFSRIGEKEKAKIDSFCKKNPHIEQYSLFCALKKENNGSAWYLWEEDVKLRKKEALEKARKRLSAEILFCEFIQYEFFSQWQSLKEYANKKGISVIGDMPIYLSHDSADVWANPHLFSLAEDMSVQNCAGVPPDYFCADGQKWGNPLYNWENLSKENYSLWKDRIKSALSLYDAVRIDHFRAFSAYWSIPAKESAVCGKWEKGPGMDFFNIIKDEFPSARIIAEDLGDIDDGVRELLKETGFPGMGVMQFAFITDSDTNHLPHNYTKNTVAYTGTHDNNTILGWLWEADEKARTYALDYCGFDGDWGEGGAKSASVRAFIRTLWSSGASLAIVPAQDLCGFGADTVMNHPGKAEGNWEFRLTNEALSSVDRSFYKKMNTLYKRFSL